MALSKLLVLFPVAAIAATSLAAEFRVVTIEVDTSSSAPSRKEQCYEEMIALLDASPAWIASDDWMEKYADAKPPVAQGPNNRRVYMPDDRSRKDMLSLRVGDGDTLKVALVVEAGPAWGRAEAIVDALLDVVKKYYDPSRVKVVRPISPLIVQSLSPTLRYGARHRNGFRSFACDPGDDTAGFCPRI